MQFWFNKQSPTHVWHAGISIKGLHMLHWALWSHRLYLCFAELQSALHLVPYFPATLSVTTSLPHCFSWKAEGGHYLLPAACAWWFIGWTGVARTGLSSCELNSSGAKYVCVCANFHGSLLPKHTNEQESCTHRKESTRLITAANHRHAHTCKEP